MLAIGAVDVGMQVARGVSVAVAIGEQLEAKALGVESGWRPHRAAAVEIAVTPQIDAAEQQNRRSGCRGTAALKNLSKTQAMQLWVRKCACGLLRGEGVSCPAGNGVGRRGAARYSLIADFGFPVKTVSTTPYPAPPTAAELSRRRLTIGFLNFAHALDHFVILIYPTVVIELEAVYGRSYATLIWLSTASFVAFGLFSLPAGWLADRWSRRNMMVGFYVGCGLSLLGAALAPSLLTLAMALFSLGVFAAIYHPVGTAMIIESATQRGRTLAFNGVCGNLGVSLAAGVTAALTAALSWRGAFLVPGAICILTGLGFWRLVPDETRHTASRSTAPDVSLSATVAAAVFGLFVVVALSAGLVFNTISVAVA